LKKKGLFLVFVLMMLSACGLFSNDGPPPTPEPTRVVLQFEAAGDINPNIAGRSSPLVVRIYQLTSYSNFYDAEFISLFAEDDETLGRELVHKQELFLKPNDKRTVYFEAPNDVRTIGILAAFRYFDQGRWRVATSVQKNKTNVVNVFINGTDIQIK
jgi:type VI secretion system protein VasD